ncbi:MAG: CBS domain-containing protein [Chloroflexia bacterium]|nr:CBS domain-containing protein [Chloroflexia bacterium]
MSYLDKTTVREVMHRGVITCAPDTALKEVARIMNATDVHALVVVNERDEAQGVVSHMDLLGAFGQDLYALQAEHVMSRAVFSVTPDTPLSAAVALMLENRVHRLLVVREDGEVKVPLGIVSTTDVIDAMWGRPWLWERPKE